MGRKLKQGRTVDLAAAGSFGSLSGTPSAVGADGSASDDGGDGSDDASHMGTSWALQLASLLCNCVYECNLPVSAAYRLRGLIIIIVIILNLKDCLR